MLTMVSIIIVGIATTVGMSMFHSNSADSNRKAVVGDLQVLASKARVYFVRPASAAGGNRSFAGLTFGRLSPRAENENGRYYIESATNDELIVVGKGKIAEGEEAVEVHMHMLHEKIQSMEIIH
jgi:type II secretory pathway pseudopilin PulG